MLHNKFVFQIIGVCAALSLAAGAGSAQPGTSGQNPLPAFEKRIRQGEYAQVERDLLNYAIANPSDARAFELLGTLRAAQTRLAESKSLFQKALSLSPGSILSRIGLAEVDRRLGNTERSLAVLGEISDADIREDQLRLRLAEAFALAGDCEKALSNVEKLDLRVKNGDALPLRARCHLRSGEQQKVDALVPFAKSLARRNAPAALKFAEVLSNSSMFREAAEVLRLIIAAASTNSEALILLAKTEVYLKDLTNAEIHLRQAAKLNSKSPDLLVVEALLEGERGNREVSLKLLEKSLQADANSPEVLSRFVVTAMRAGEAGKAFNAAEKLSQLRPDEPEYIYLLGASALQNNNLPAAESSLKRFAELRPRDARGCLALGLTYAAQPDKIEAARAQLKRCADADANDYQARYQLGLSYKAQGEIAKAIEYFEETIRISADYAPALRDLGSVYVQAGSEAKARAVLEKAAALDPGDADTHFQLGRLYNLMGETELAKKQMDIFQKLRGSAKSGM